jgi:hypothetical protein
LTFFTTAGTASGGGLRLFTVTATETDQSVKCSVVVLFFVFPIVATDAALGLAQAVIAGIVE